MSYLFPDNNTGKQSTLTLDRLKSIVHSTSGKRLERIAALQMEVSILLDSVADLLEDEAHYQNRMGILPEVSARAGEYVNGVPMPNMLSTLPMFSRANRPTALASVVNEDPFADLAGSNNVIIKDPQMVLAYNHLLHALAPVYKHIKLHEHRIRNACLTVQKKLHLIEELQTEQTRIQGQ